MMKKLLFAFAFVGGFLVQAQAFTPLKNKKEKIDDFTIEVKQSEKNLIDWKAIKEHFSDKKGQDSIQISIKIKSEMNKKVNSRKKYTVRGTKNNLDEMLLKLKEKIKK